MYLEKLYINKSKLKSLESCLSNELFNGKTIQIKYDSKIVKFYLYLYKDKIYLSDFFDLKNEQNQKIDITFDKVEFVKKSNIILSKLLKNGATYLKSAITYYDNKANEQRNFIYQNYDRTKYSL